MFKLLVVISVLFSPTSANPGGAPDAACGERTPRSDAPPNGHGAAPQMGTAPYSVRFAEGITTYTDGTPVEGYIALYSLGSVENKISIFIAFACLQ